MWNLRFCLALCVPFLLVGGCTRAVGQSSYTHVADVIYGRKFGLALTMDVFAPLENANGAAVVWVVSGGWLSAHQYISLELSQGLIKTLVQRGYTVFAVVHSSQPKFNIPEMLPDIDRAVRYIRYHAAEYSIDPDRIGIAGASSGGHLALMQAVAGEDGDPGAKDPVGRVSSRVQAVACFFPPSDFLNYGQPGENALGRNRLRGFPAPFAFPESDPQKKRAIGRQISPFNHITPDDPPTLIIHGDQDALVPLEQSETMIAKLKREGIYAQLIVKHGAGHGWPGIEKDMPKIADWFDKYLPKSF